MVRLTANFDVGFHSGRRGFEFHGDPGSLIINNCHNFNGMVEYAGFDGTWPDVDTADQPIPSVMEPYGGDSRWVPGSGVDWGRGGGGMVEAIRDNRPQRISGAQAADVVDVISTIHRSFRTVPSRGRRSSANGTDGAGEMEAVQTSPESMTADCGTAPRPSRLKR